MPYMLSQISVEDYNKWKPVFDEMGAIRQAAGCKGGFVFRNADDPNQISAWSAWDNLNNARAYAGLMRCAKPCIGLALSWQGRPTSPTLMKSTDPRPNRF
jgi:hypothetical protein